MPRERDAIEGLAGGLGHHELLLAWAPLDFFRFSDLQGVRFRSRAGREVQIIQDEKYLAARRADPGGREIQSIARVTLNP